jgi:hypothetical protein
MVAGGMGSCGTMGTRLLAIGDGVTPTGIARIVHSVLRRLPKVQYEIHHLAHNYFGDPHEEPWKIYPASIGGPGYGFHRVRELVRLILTITLMEILSELINVFEGGD